MNIPIIHDSAHIDALKMIAELYTTLFIVIFPFHNFQKNAHLLDMTPQRLMLYLITNLFSLLRFTCDLRSPSAHLD